MKTIAAKVPTLAQVVTAAVSGERIHFTDEQSQEQRSLRDASPELQAEPGVMLPFYGDWETRALTATGQSSVAGDQGGMTISTNVPEIGTAFRGKLVLEKLGARVFGGLRGNVNLPTAKAATIAAGLWVSENAANTTASELLVQLNLIPRRVNAWIDVSVQLLKQVDLFNAFVTSELLDALAIEMQAKAITGLGAGSNQPVGILGTAGIGSIVGGANGAAPTGANILDLEYAVTGTGKADRGNVGWLASPYVRRKLRQTAIIPAQGWPVWDLDEAYALVGHPAGVTTSVPDNLVKGASGAVCSAIICGEFSELIMGIWGQGIVIDIIPDATLALSGLVRVNATAYFNSGVRTPTAFAAMQDALCA